MATENKNKATELTLEESFGELDAILGEMEQGDLPLEDAFLLYERGMRLLVSCRDKITTIEQKIESISADGVIEDIEDLPEEERGSI